MSSTDALPGTNAGGGGAGSSLRTVGGVPTPTGGRWCRGIAGEPLGSMDCTGGSGA